MVAISVEAGRARPLAIVPAVIAACLGFAAGALPLLRPPVVVFSAITLALGLGIALLALRAARGDTRPELQERTARWLTLLLPLPAGILAAIVALAILRGYPNSADEYGYMFLADTLAAGRLWNDVPNLAEVFDFFYIVREAGKWVSQYPPGFPAMLVAADLVALPRSFVNPLLGAATTAALVAALRLRGAAWAVVLPLAAMVALSPFAVFNAASLFTHQLSAFGVVAIVAARLWAERRDAWWKHVMIGVLFSVLLVTRYEVFAIAALAHVADGLWRRRVAFIPEALLSAAGGLPIGLAFLAYNAAITGDPLQTVLAWGFPDLRIGLWGTGVDGAHYRARALQYTARWLLALVAFAGLTLIGLWVLGLSGAIRAHALRLDDLLFPALVVFFVFYPDYGGFQFGPRYWYAAFPLIAMTAAACVRSPPAVPVAAIAAAAIVQTAANLGFIAGHSAFAHALVEARSDPLVLARALERGIVLVPTHPVHVSRWQIRPLEANSLDYPRNGIDLEKPVQIARDLGRARDGALCAAYPGTPLYRYVPEGKPTRGRLEPQPCP
ncbi:hypothetical protein [Elioraea rosea]|uniref:hypothetical protein n=1 Tax=Elioraea rosea TaxID=2492390 RepID=UPI001182E4EA|nr:hypothetical protein [Elioraea rosea]